MAKAPRPKKSPPQPHPMAQMTPPRAAPATKHPMTQMPHPLMPQYQASAETEPTPES